jgi:hypothetical protein
MMIVLERPAHTTSTVNGEPAIGVLCDCVICQARDHSTRALVQSDRERVETRIIDNKRALIRSYVTCEAMRTLWARARIPFTVLCTVTAVVAGVDFSTVVSVADSAALKLAGVSLR